MRSLLYARRCNTCHCYDSLRKIKQGGAAHEVVLRRSNCIKMRHTYAVAGVNDSNSSADELWYSTTMNQQEQ